MPTELLSQQDLYPSEIGKLKKKNCIVNSDGALLLQDQGTKIKSDVNLMQ